MNNLYALLGRIGLSLIFILSGWSKLAAYAGTEQYMQAMGVPGALLPLVIALEIGGGLAVLAGVFTRSSALALAVFSLAAGVLFHADLADQNQFIHLMKNVAIGGGFLMLAANGAGAFSVDAWRSERKLSSPTLSTGGAL
ncbi:MAG: DoxX family protein [Caulobacter sp.]|nr:DoxX family protein [Caulobacter sp.]MBO9717427.1 DoxX family protein [Pseudoxanthomonas sp.]